MTDKEFILFLMKVLWDDLTGGSPDDDFAIIRKELIARDINPDDVMPY